MSQMAHLKRVPEMGSTPQASQLTPGCASGSSASKTLSLRSRTLPDHDQLTFIGLLLLLDLSLFLDLQRILPQSSLVFAVLSFDHSLLRVRLLLLRDLRQEFRILGKVVVGEAVEVGLERRRWLVVRVAEEKVRPPSDANVEVRDGLRTSVGSLAEDEEGEERERSVGDLVSSFSEISAIRFRTGATRRRTGEGERTRRGG